MQLQRSSLFHILSQMYALVNYVDKLASYHIKLMEGNATMNTNKSNSPRFNKRRRRVVSRAIISSVSALLLLFSSLSSAGAASEKKSPSVTYAPESPTTINGVPETSDSGGRITPMLNYKVSTTYNASTGYPVQYFKLIATATHDNRNSAGLFKLGLKIEQSTSQGSEFSGNIEFSGEVKVAIFAGIQSKVGYSVKETRSYNEAVGWNGTMDCPAYKYCTFDAFYEGVASGGTVVEKWYSDSLGGYYTNSYPVNVKVHPTALKINSRSTTSP
ncbi:hypothetical protein GE107_09205 [Cohnella sp. CFH 77786]|uniref:hypothetical protein n=1 Tax=Cohnella sp. CFH 77786 TaxID=2662265 RepID=UPI001C60D1B5|nr:hypothetical protein [Cohnella sp. CFH 77786]MBW5446235.1 hypothetical protein [Cohnella sp. CFH 77786]